MLVLCYAVRSVMLIVSTTTTTKNSIARFFFVIVVVIVDVIENDEVRASPKTISMFNFRKSATETSQLHDIWCILVSLYLRALNQWHRRQKWGFSERGKWFFCAELFKVSEMMKRVAFPQTFSVAHRFNDFVEGSKHIFRSNFTWYTIARGY